MILKPIILRALDRMSGQPMTRQAIIDTVRLAYPGTPEADIDRTLNKLEAGGYVLGASNEMLETTVWVLTNKGTLAIGQL